MFRTISIIGFAGVLVLIILHHLLFKCFKGCKCHPIDIIKKPIHLFTLMLVEQKRSLLGALKKLVYLLAIFCFVILVITGFYPRLVLDKAIYGYWMMIHATAAGIFSACLAFLAVMWAQQNTFNSADWPGLLSFLRQIIKMPVLPIPQTRPDYSCLCRKICFWLLVVLSLPLILSIIFSMFRLFGTDMQEFLLASHRYSALSFALIAIIHTYLTVYSEMNE